LQARVQARSAAVLVEAAVLRSAALLAALVVAVVLRAPAFVLRRVPSALATR
jgi:hypothetical protein